MTNLQKSFSACFEKEDCSILLDEPLKNHNYFKIGGNAEILVIPKKEAVLLSVLKYADERSIPLHILGNGSNVLISDDGLKGIVVKLMGGLTDLLYMGEGIIACSAGVSLSRLSGFARDNSLTGLEFAYGIPGSVGGAVFMNAGAYGGEIKDVLMSARSVDIKGTDVKETKIEELDLSYRHSAFMSNNRIITGAYFKLAAGNKDEISARMEELINKRKTSQPLEYPSAGSTFKRPRIGYAAQLIDECGLKGLCVGDAEVSTKHAGFVINKGNASFNDVISLIEMIKETVFNEKGVLLVPEVEILKD